MKDAFKLAISNIMQVLAFALGVLAVLFYIDSLFVHIFTNVPIEVRVESESEAVFEIIFVAIVLAASNALGAIFYSVSKKLKLTVRLEFDDEQDVLDRRYGARKRPGLYFCAIGIPFIASVVIYWFAGMSGDVENGFYYLVLAGLLPIGISAITFIAAPKNTNFCESCHKDMGDPSWDHVSTDERIEKKTKHYSGGSNKVGYLDDGKGNTVDIYKSYEGGDYEVERTVTEKSFKRDCPHCGHTHKRYEFTSTEWK